jgi:hypothetical protein
MNHAILLLMCWLVIVCGLMWPTIDAVPAGTWRTQIQPVKRCIQDAELRENFATLKLEGGPEVAKVYESLLTKARSTPECRTEVVQALIRRLEQANKDTTNKNEKFYLWQSGAGLLADLKAVEALDLLIANIDLTDGWSSTISQYHTPVLIAILKIGAPAIPKLHIFLKNVSVPYKRNFAAFCIAYIGGAEARKALLDALPGETDPCVKKFLQISLQAFDNKKKPNHISSELRGKWGSAFYCL